MTMLPRQRLTLPFRALGPSVRRVTAARRLLRPRLARTIVVRALACVAALAVLLAVVRGGSAVFYCAPMQAAMATPCCDEAELAEEHASADADADADALVASPCCVARRVADMKPAPLPSAPPELAAPLSHVVARLDAVTPREPPAQAAARAHGMRARAPTALERRAELMVFHL